MQVASLGLIKAIDRFDPAKGTRFSSFAVPTILGELKRHFRDRGWALHVPRTIQDRTLRITRETERLSTTLGRAPTAAELGDALGLTVEEVIEAEAAASAYRTDSLDAPGDEDGAPLVDLIGADDEQFALVDERTTLAVSWRGLPRAQRQVLRLRFVEDLTQREIGERIGYLADARLAAAAGGDRQPAARLTSPQGSSSPAHVQRGHLAQRVQLGVGLGVRVLQRDARAELDVLADRVAERRIVRQPGGVERRHVELDEPRPLLLGDPEAAVDGDQVREPQLAREPVGPAERLGGERGQVVDVLRPARPEQRLQQRVAQHAGVEDVLEPVERRLAAGVLEQRGHPTQGNRHARRWSMVKSSSHASPSGDASQRPSMRSSPTVARKRWWNASSEKSGSSRWSVQSVPSNVIR